MSEVLFPVELLEESRYCDLGCSGNAEFVFCERKMLLNCLNKGEEVVILYKQTWSYLNS